MQIKDLKKFDVVEIQRPDGIVRGLVVRCYTSGGRSGVHVRGANLHNEQEVEVLCDKDSDLRRVIYSDAGEEEPVGKHTSRT